MSADLAAALRAAADSIESSGENSRDGRWQRAKDEMKRVEGEAAERRKSDREAARAKLGRKSEEDEEPKEGDEDAKEGEGDGGNGSD